ncbi:zinc-finger double domain-containing protein [Ditylenchus destructor]|nr:zinc-finger double domain-containing protein [Ditylenchus destructor]
MRVSSSTRILSKEESDRIAREEAYASEIPGITHIKAAENNTKDQCDGFLVETKRGRLSRREKNVPHIPEDNSSATSIEDGENLQEHGFGDSTDESETDDDESEYGIESESDSEPVTSKTRAHNSMNKNCREKKVHGRTRQKARLQLNRKQHLMSNVGRAVDGEKRYKCKQCHYATNVESQFTIHMRTHTGERPFKCKKCNYAATKRSNLIIHERYHSGEKPYKCEFCKYAAAERCNLIKHIRIHTGEKPYKCRFCKYAAAQRGNLNQHMRTHHKHALKHQAANSKKTGKRIVLKKSGIEY